MKNGAVRAAAAAAGEVLPSELLADTKADQLAAVSSPLCSSSSWFRCLFDLVTEDKEKKNQQRINREEKSRWVIKKTKEKTKREMETSKSEQVWWEEENENTNRRRKENNYQTWAAMRAHLLPSLAWSSTMSLSSSGENAPFLRLGLKWLAHLSLQLFPHLDSPEFFCTEFQFPSPCLFTYSTSTASSAVVHGPFFSPWLAPPLPPIPDVASSLNAPPPPLLLIIFFFAFYCFTKLYICIYIDMYIYIWS